MLVEYFSGEIIEKVTPLLVVVCRLKSVFYRGKQDS